ncbi:ef hand family protein [Stylonychia lemnae]|uniref:Ef hand family protein n=1 Tax=Stylonychia lemnae TaxID=5949 RepID=A0A078AIL2_STYLE|nr:ef hand family protein [Stylonychia lemnae]|eukprot:CDW82059.1 ef hand family protein [Stylonychia lemnae]
MNSDGESADENQFDQYQKFFKIDDDGEGFDKSDEYSFHDSQTSKKQGTLTNKPSAITSSQIKKQTTVTAAVNNKLGTKAQIKQKSEESDNYDDDFGQEIQIKGTQNKNQNEESDEFVDVSDDFQAFQYDKKEFDVDASDSQQSSKFPVFQENQKSNKFTVNQEQEPDFLTSCNVFKKNAMTKSLVPLYPIGQNNQFNQQEDEIILRADSKMSDSAKEIQFKQQSEIQSQQDVGFDDDIDDEVFKEESIQDEFDDEQQVESNRSNVNTKNAQGYTQNMVNMGSVIPNPKIVSQIPNSSTQTNTIINRQQISHTNPLDTKLFEQNIGKNSKNNEETHQFPIIEYEKDDDDDMAEIHDKINAIPSRFSDAGSPDKFDKQATGKKEEKKQQPTQKVDKKRTGSKARPQTAKPNVSKPRTQSKPPKQETKEIKKKININAQANQQVQPEEEEKLPDEQAKQSLIEKVTKNLLQTKNKSSRTIIRPESAKPKVGYEGNPNNLVKPKPISANHNDLTALLLKSEKFQKIKKIKEENKKKQDVVVRNLKNVKVIQQKQQEARIQQKAEVLKKQALDILEDDSFFEQAASIKGDQGVAPGMNADLEDFNDDFEQIEPEQIVGKNTRQIAAIRQQMEQEKSQNYQTKTEGNTQKLAPMNQSQTVTKQLARQTPQSIALQKQKEQTQAGNTAKNSQVLGGDNQERFNEILRQKKEKLVNKDVLGFMMEKNLRNQNEKKEALTQNINRLAKDFEVKDVAKQTQAIQQQQIKGSDKVPEHAKLVIDDEKLVKELADLKKRFKETILENMKVCNNIKMVEKKKRDKETLLDKVMSDKNLITINGALTVQQESKNSTGLLYGIKLEDIPDFDKLAQERINPLDSIVKKFEQKGITIEQAFDLFDDDEDRVLTMQEIKKGIKNQRIELLDSEYQELIKVIDKNSDGVLTMEEWVNCLNPKYDAEKEFRQIMQNVDIDDPLILEERILDLRYRSERIEKELEFLRETSANEQGIDLKERIRRKMKNPMEKKYANKILALESRLANKISNTMFEKIMLEDKIKQSLMAKDQVQQDYYDARRVKDRLATEFDMRLETISGSLNVLDQKLNEVTQLNMVLKTERDVFKQKIHRLQISLASMTDMEAKLDKQLEEILGRALTGQDLEMLYQLDLKTLNQLNSGQNEVFDNYVKQFACITIQRMFRGSMARHEYAIMKFQVKRLKRILVPLVKERFQMKRIEATILIQRFYRRHRDRQKHLENLRRKNMMRRLKEEEDDRFYQDIEKQNAAAMTILRHWRSYKRRQMRDLGMISKINQKLTFGREIEVIYLAQIRKCFICKIQNALRFCTPCKDALYCDNCYIDYHIRGHRKLHSYKRIRYGDKKFNEEDENREREIFLKKENKNPNSFQLNIDKVQETKLILDKPPSNKINTTNIADGSFSFRNQQANNFTLNNINEDSFARDSKRFMENNDTFRVNDKELIKKDSDVRDKETLETYNQELQKIQLMIHKNEKQTDEGFLGQVKRKCKNIQSELFAFIDDTEIVRLSELMLQLTEYPKIFNLTIEEIEKLCEIAESKCQCDRPSNSEEDSMGQAAEFEKQKFSHAFSMDSYLESWNKLVNLFSPSEEQKQEQWDKLQKTGMMRSGEGSAEEVMQRRKKLEERQRLDQLLQSGDFSSDPIENKKLYDHYLKHVNQNSVKNDDVDLIPYISPFGNTHYMSLQQIDSQQLKSQMQGRTLQTTGSAVSLYNLVEPYPTSCKNNGQLVNQTQVYYFCKPTGQVGGSFSRVDKNSYDLIIANYSSLYECAAQNTVRQVCFCPQGFYDYQCSTQLYRQCFVNITDPPLYKGCKKEDSPYYLYSVPGYDPCFYLDFTQKQNIGFILTCKYTDEVSSINSKSENIGYQYRDVVQPAQVPEFQYTAVNPTTQMKTLIGQSAQVQISIFDWKWLSQQANFMKNISDPLILAGLKEDRIEVDFAKLMKSDQEKKSKYIAGGRAYFEADVLGQLIYSYTSKGFFDQANYVEPAAPENITWKIIVGVVVPGVVIGIIGSIILYCQIKKRKQKLNHID